MSFKEEFKAAEGRADSENTSQNIFNTLRDLESEAPSHARRWIWELLQNAGDAAIPGSPLHVAVCITDDNVRFQHNGVPFSVDQVAHLIRHGSTKCGDEGQVGRFGTGFLSTHMISTNPRVSGWLTDGRSFTFVLDRTGNSPTDLMESMKRSSDDFIQSVVNDSAAPTGDHVTRYDYPLTSEVHKIADRGVESLEEYAPYVLAFNEELDSIRIERGGKVREYRRGHNTELGAGVMVTPVDVQSADDPNLPPFAIATATEATVTAAVVARRIGDTFEIAFGPTVPRLFMAFPLFGSECIRLPGVINSNEFRPKKDRDGLYLGETTTPDNTANKLLLQHACPLLLKLLRECACHGWKGIDLLCRIAAVGDLKGIDARWVKSLIRDSLVRPIVDENLVRSCDKQLISVSYARIPLGSSAVPSDSLWSLAAGLSNSDGSLVEQATAGSWEENLRCWAEVFDTPPEEMDQSVTLEKLARRLAQWESLDRLCQRLRDGLDPIGWCNNLFDLLIQADRSALFDEMEILPDQHGTLRQRAYLSSDNQIDEELKEIGEMLGIHVRKRLLHNGVTSYRIHALLPSRGQADVLAEIIATLQEQANEITNEAAYRQANVRLFAWILKHGTIESLESFPVLTQESSADGQAPHIIVLTGRDPLESVPLAPPECWPKEVEAFSDLFPMRHVLSSDYYAACRDETCWTHVSERGFVRLTPVFEMLETIDDVKDFVLDDHLSEDCHHGSKEQVNRTQIAFLTEKNVGLIHAARTSRSKCVLFLRFLAAYMISNDASWKGRSTVECECGQRHDYWKAAWIVPLRNISWIYLDKNHSDYLSAESLATFLKDDKDIVGLLAERDGPSFLDALGVSVTDFLIRSVTPDEKSRVTLSKSFIQMFRAVKGDIGQMNDIAEEIAAHPETVKELRERGEIRRRIKRNQDVGKAVEEALRAALGTGHGLKVDRDPIGSDYSVEPENDFLKDDGSEILLRVSKFLIEIKATVGKYVRMTNVQGKKARDASDHYVLCVVPLPDQEELIDKDSVRAKVRFVTDIGAKIKPLVEAVESLEGSRDGVLGRIGPIEVEMQDQNVKFRVEHTVWEAGVDFDEAVRHFGGRSDHATVSTLEPVPNA